jgi:hypothetical protein
MGSEPNAVVRLRRAVANPRTTAMQIRAIAAEIPYPVGLEDALAILLAILDREPGSYSKGAARWASRLALEHKLTLADAQLALAALAVLPTPGARAGVEALIDLAERSGLRRVDVLLGDWMRRGGIGD